MVPSYADGIVFKRRVEANQAQRTVLLRAITSVPYNIDRYFKTSLVNRVLWVFISVGTGFYVGNTLTLSFGALAINDVVAAIAAAVFCDYSSRLFWNAKRKTYKLWLLNAFKYGVVLAAAGDAAKLGW